MLTKTLFLRRKEKNHWKKLNCEFIRINASKSFDEDYGIGRIETFISEFQDNQLKNQKKNQIKK